MLAMMLIKRGDQNILLICCNIQNVITCEPSVGPRRKSLRPRVDECHSDHQAPYHAEQNPRTCSVHQCLRCCATIRKVAGSIPAGVIGIFHRHKILPIALLP